MTKNKLLTIILFVISPLFSMFFVFIEIFQKKKYALTLFSIFIGMLSYICIPIANYDLVAHYFFYDEYSNLSVREMLLYLDTKNDYILHIVSFIFGKLGISRQFLPFLAVFVSLQLLFYILHDVYKSSSKKKYFTAFILLFLATEIVSLVFGLRNVTAITLFTYGLYLIYYKKNKKGFIWFFIALLLHKMILLPILLFFLSTYVIRLRPFTYKFLIILSILFSLIFPFILQNIIRFIGEGLGYQEIINAYIDRRTFSEYLNKATLSRKIYFYIKTIPYFSIMAFLIIIKKKNKLTYFSYTLVVLASLMISYRTFFERISILCVMTTILIYIIEYKNSLRLKYFGALFLLTFIINKGADLYGMRTSLPSLGRIVYQNSISVFFVKVTNNDIIENSRDNTNTKANPKNYKIIINKDK